MLEGKSIALIMFTVLNALGVVFLLYVLVKFWNEGHKSKGGARPTFVVSAPIAAERRPENGRLIRFPIRGGSEQQLGDEAVKHAVR